MATTPSYFLNLGVLTIPLKEYPAARQERVELRNLHRDCAATLSTRKVCTACHADVKPEQEVKGYEAGKGQYVLLEKDEVAALTVESDKTMSIQGFVPAKDVDAVYLGRSNYLGPADQPAAKAFALLREAMKTTGRAAVVRYTESHREKLGLVRVVDEALMLHELFYPSEVRTYRDQARVKTEPVEISKAELDLAVKLVKVSAKSFDLSGESDPYQKRIASLVESRLTGQTQAVASPKPKPVASQDLMAALEQSLAAIGTNGKAA